MWPENPFAGSRYDNLWAERPAGSNSEKARGCFPQGLQHGQLQEVRLENELYLTEGGGDTGQELLNSLNTGSKDAKDVMLKLGLIK